VDGVSDSPTNPFAMMFHSILVAEIRDGGDETS
jgi:hypothetical protein